MAETQVEKFDPAKLMDGVKDRIKATFISIIPDNQWDQMVKKVIDEWFTQKYEAGYQQVYASNFERVVWSELEIYARPIIKQKIELYKEYSWDDDGSKKVNAMIEQMIIKNAGKILTKLIGETLQQSIINNTSFR